MNPRRLFMASCISLIASAFSFMVRQDILPAWGRTFGLNATQLGVVGAAAFQGMAIAMLVGAPLCDKLGMKLMLGLAFLCHLGGTLLTIATPWIVPSGQGAFYLLCGATFLVGAANGLVEIGINPLAATLYPTEKTHRLNVLHAWWPGGLILGGLISLAMSKIFGLAVGGVATDATVKLFGLTGERAIHEATTLGWQIKMSIILIPTFIYGLLFLRESFPPTERVASGVSTREMFFEAMRPMFLLWAFCMLLTSSTELAPQGMQSLVLQHTANMNGTIVIVYTSFIMFLLRHFAGPIAHRLSPVGMLTGSAILSAIGLYALSFAYNGVTAIAAATIYGLGIVYFWPTMLGVTAERFPRGGAFLLGLMGCVGNIAIGVVQPAMGGINDQITIAAIPSEIRNQVVVSKVVDEDKVKLLPEEQQKAVAAAQTEGARWSFRYVTILPIILVFIFGGIALSDRARGGYRPEEITKAKEFTEAEVASDY